MAERTPTDQYGYATPAQSVDLGQVTVLGYQIPPWSNLGASSTESGNTASITDYLRAEFIRNGRLSMTPAREITETTSATEHYEGQGFVVSGSYATLSNGVPTIITAVSLPTQSAQQQQPPSVQYDGDGVNPQDLYWPNYPQ